MPIQTKYQILQTREFRGTKFKLKMNNVGLNSLMPLTKAETILKKCVYYQFSMGGICPILAHKGPNEIQDKNKKTNNQAKTTERALNEVGRSNSDEEEPNCTMTQKKNIMNLSVNSITTVGKGERMTKNLSTAFGSSVLERKNSSLLFQGCIFESSSIILRNNRESLSSQKQTDKNCYVLIDNVFLVKKSMDSIKVMSPHSQSQLNCPINNIPSTYYLTQGLPLDSIKQIATGKIIQTSQSPIRTKIKLICKNCLLENKKKGIEKVRVVKMTFSTSLITIKQIVCDQCRHKGEWKIENIQSNFPVWGNGHKIQKDQSFQSAPSTIRVMGCVSCLRYTDIQQLPCGCSMCKNCLSENQTKECRLCQAVN